MPCSSPASVVFRCFKCIERSADRATGAAGPVLVTLGVGLLGMGTVCFFDVIEPTLPFRLLLTPLCVLIAGNMFAHYYYACTVPPGFTQGPVAPGARGTAEGDRMPEPRGWNWAPMRRDRREWEMQMTPARVTLCRRCGGRKPERAHHCRVCNRCVLKYDHHCPGINQCVGIYNERHFVLFMFYLVLATWSFVIAGYSNAWEAMGFEHDWPHRSPGVAFIMTYILSIAIGLAVFIMLAWQVWGIAVGETAVESQDFAYYRRLAKERGETFVNAYDIGKRRNLELFFNTGPDGLHPWWAMLLPLRALPYTDGYSWARARGEHVGIGFRPDDEVLTDEEEA
ncbi:zf-DHHC-domain-containing protein [Auricularia subglabra TFB-10046 SS5]|uniref:Palmitoyltransferase n=1 Tax=Auricularia subglabra (strain TFB-10046 / SS5) TaxID=717982 RepID=J0D0F1_AURST|nr:zf-DHHC-domain-containing protein [Auricularia subglabra TFB-10046 SS5]